MNLKSTQYLRLVSRLLLVIIVVMFLKMFETASVISGIRKNANAKA